ncbi:hypothetical protein BH688_05550 [Kushneria phosphatilytica]|nr:hypothetical protein BH688_05550 [Kushneria phosphatilytica]
MWARYLRKRGSINTGRRLETGFAYLLAAVYRLAGNRDISPGDFMPHEVSEPSHQWSAPDNTESATFDEFLNELRKAA